MVEAFVTEQDIVKIKSGAIAVFYPENLDLPSLSCQLQTIAAGSTQNLPVMLASTYGGPIAARVSQDKKQVPEIAQYRLLLDVKGSFDKPPACPAILRGTLKLQTIRSSLIAGIWQELMVVSLRESGF